jgi:hypothetical protein
MCECAVCLLSCRLQSPQPLFSYFRGLHEVKATEDASSVLCEHIDAKDSGGSWYQAFIIARDQTKIRVHFNGWGTNVIPLALLTPRLYSHAHFPSHTMTQYDEDIPAADIATRTRPRNADTALGGSGNETDEAVRAGVTASLIRHDMMALSDSRCLHP